MHIDDEGHMTLPVIVRLERNSDHDNDPLLIFPTVPSAPQSTEGYGTVFAGHSDSYTYVSGDYTTMIDNTEPLREDDWGDLVPDLLDTVRDDYLDSDTGFDIESVEFDVYQRRTKKLREQFEARHRELFNR